MQALRNSISHLKNEALRANPMRPFARRIQTHTTDIRTTSEFKGHVEARRWVVGPSLAQRVKEELEILKRKTFEIDPKRLAEVTARYKAGPVTFEPVPTTCEFFSTGTKTKESFGGDYLSNAELEHYKSWGMLGPHKSSLTNSRTIKSVTQYLEKNQLGYNIWSSPFLDLIRHSAILSKVQSIIGDDVKIIAMQAFIANPQAGANINSDVIRMHNGDTASTGTHFELGGRNRHNDDSICTAWISLSGTTEANSPLRYFQGTGNFRVTPSEILHYCEQRGEVERFLKAVSSANDFHKIWSFQELCYEILLQRIGRDPSLANAVGVDTLTEPGDFNLFNKNILHESGVNQTDTPRMAMGVRYTRATNPPLFDNTWFNNLLGFLTENLSPQQLKTIGFPDAGDKRIPILQASGSQHHPDSVAIDIEKLKSVLMTLNRG